MTALNEDRMILASFLKKLVGVQKPASSLTLLEQQYPGEPPLSEEEAERRGIPDAWIFDAEGWCIFVESKVQSPLKPEQINRHRKTAERRGFSQITALAIVVNRPSSINCDCLVLEWRQIYEWLNSIKLRSRWAYLLSDYFEALETKMIASESITEGMLTMFTGIPFTPKNPYTYLEGKRVLGVALKELRKRSDLRKIGMDPSLSGRPSITGAGTDRVWDYLRLDVAKEEDKGTEHPHLTLGFHSRSAEAMLTIPHSVNRKIRNRISALNLQQFTQRVAAVREALSPLVEKHNGIRPWFRGIQRHFPSRRISITDAEINFDLRTLETDERTPVKSQPVWISAGYDAFVQRGGTNYQFQVGAVFDYEKCPEIHTNVALDIIASAWIACAPFISLARE